MVPPGSPTPGGHSSSRWFGGRAGKGAQTAGPSFWPFLAVFGLSQVPVLRTHREELQRKGVPWVPSPAMQPSRPVGGVDSGGEHRRCWRICEERGPTADPGGYITHLDIPPRTITSMAATSCWGCPPTKTAFGVVGHLGVLVPPAPLVRPTPSPTCISWTPTDVPAPTGVGWMVLVDRSMLQNPTGRTGRRMFLGLCAREPPQTTVGVRWAEGQSEGKGGEGGGYASHDTLEGYTWGCPMLWSGRITESPTPPLSKPQES